MQGLKVENVTFSYHHNKTILSDINVEIKEQESVGIIGANGVGKSTLLKLLVGLVENKQGTIEINDLQLNKKNLRDIRAAIGYVFQDSDSQLFMSTVYDDVAFGPQNYGYSEPEIQKRVKEALVKVHIEALKDRRIYQLSGGEKKLVSIATILAMQPEIILLDEPTVALDPRNRKNLIEVVNGIEKIKLIASHDLDFIMDTCKRTILLADGKIVKDADTMEILMDKELLESNGLEVPLSLSRNRISIDKNCAEGKSRWKQEKY